MQLQEHELYTTKELAKALKVSEQSLINWRKEGKGPPYKNLTPHRRKPTIRYYGKDVLQFLKSA